MSNIPSSSSNLPSNFTTGVFMEGKASKLTVEQGDIHWSNSIDKPLCLVMPLI